MGVMISYNCRCGYKKDINIGKGMRSFTSTSYACVCLSCREIMQVEIDDKADKNKASCPVCGGKLIVYPEDSSILCPKCGTKNEPQFAGRWD